MSLEFQIIRAAFSSMRRDSKARHRDIAEKLGISEGALIAAHAGFSDEPGHIRLGAIRLRSQWAEIIESLEPLGEVMALTRNASCVSEKVGIYRQASHNGQVGLVLGGEVDLRIFYSHWTHGFAVTESSDKGLQQSLQFFDAAGSAIHKIFLKEQSDAQAYASLVADFAHEDQGAESIAGAVVALPDGRQSDEAIDVVGFRAAWRRLRDAHDFFGVLKQFGVSRLQGLRLADPEFVQRVDSGSVRQMINAAAREAVAIMVFVGNPGMMQIHTGLVHKVAVMGPWLNVLDPGFNLHLREDHLASAWVVKKPTVDGLVTSLETFDENGNVIAMFFGERKPGKSELCEWRELIAALLKEAASCAA